MKKGTILRKEEKGQSLVEMALLLPVLLILLVGMFDFGRVVYTYAHLHMAAQETVRLGGLGKGDAEMAAFAKNYVHIGDPASLDVVIEPTEENRVSGDYVKVELRYPFEWVTPLISSLFPSPMTLVTDSTIRVE